MSLKSVHEKYGAQLAQDGIPLHYGDLAAEYDAALNQAVLLDRSHEGHVQLLGESRFELLNRMSTNKMMDMSVNEGRPTIFTNPNARIIDRIIAYNLDDHLLMLTEPGRGEWLVNFLQKNIFFGDDARLVNLSPVTKMFALHGNTADAIMQELGVDVDAVLPMYATQFTVDDATISAVRRKSVSGNHWQLILPENQAAQIYETVMTAGEPQGLIPAGSLTYNTLRIRAGRPARPELNTDYIPLEIGLWDEVHFAKGCYTGQEIIARMESRSKLAKTIVALDIQNFVQAPAEITHEGRSVGNLTSSVQAPNGDIFAISVIKTQAAHVGTTVELTGTTAMVSRLLGEQPDYLHQKSE